MADPAVAAATPPVVPKADPVVAAPPAAPVKDGGAPPAPAAPAPAGDKTLLGEAGKAADPAAPPPAAPAKADYSKLKLPDGSLLPPDSVEAVKAYAEKHKLSPEAAQEEIDARAGSVKGYHDSLITGHKATVDGWKKTVTEHPKFGGANLKATDQAVTSVLKRFAPAGFQEMLQEAGYNWHPGMMEFLHNIHAATKDDTFVPSGSAVVPAAPKGLEAMYQAKKK